MRLWHIVRTRTASLLFRRWREAELREELQQHIDRETERLRAAGIAPEAARQHAVHTFGGVEQIKEACRDARGTGAIDAVSRDTRFAFRPRRAGVASGTNRPRLSLDPRGAGRTLQPASTRLALLTL